VLVHITLSVYDIVNIRINVSETQSVKQFCKRALGLISLTIFSTVPVAARNCYMLLEDYCIMQ